MALALVFSRATIWSSECSTSSKLPSARSTTPTMRTLAMLTAALRQKFCHALLKAKSTRFQSRCMVPSCIFVSDNLPAFDGDHASPHDVNDLAVVGRHQNGGSSCVDLQQELDDFPGGRRVEVPGRFIGQEDLRIVHERPRDRDSLLLAARKLIGKLVLFSFEADDAEHLFDLWLEVPQRAFSDAQGEGDILEDGEIGEQLEILKDHADLAPQERQMTALQAAEVLTLDMDLAGRDLLLADQEADQGRLAGTARSDQEDEVLLWNHERDVAQRHRAIGILLVHALQADQGHEGHYRGHADPLWQRRRCRLGCDCCWHENKSIPNAGAATGRALEGRITPEV